MESSKLFTIIWYCLSKQSSLYLWQSSSVTMVQNQSRPTQKQSSVLSNFNLFIINQLAQSIQENQMEWLANYGKVVG